MARAAEKKMGFQLRSAKRRKLRAKDRIRSAEIAALEMAQDKL